MFMNSEAELQKDSIGVCLNLTSFLWTEPFFGDKHWKAEADPTIECQPRVRRKIS